MGAQTTAHAGPDRRRARRLSAGSAGVVVSEDIGEAAARGLLQAEEEGTASEGAAGPGQRGQGALHPAHHAVGVVGRQATSPVLALILDL